MRNRRASLRDPRYDSPLVQMLILRVMKHGKLTRSRSLVYAMMTELGARADGDPMEVLQQALQNVRPTVEVKSKRVGGSTYQVPREVKNDRGTVLAIRWILGAARKRSGSGFSSRLTSEMHDAYLKTGSAMKRRNDVHRMAEANKAFAKFRF
jgi:small subunit ribosomal protein S7